MTIYVPRYAKSRPMFWIWLAQRRFRSWQHGRKRNPDCNEHRRYRDDTQFVSGEHRHLDPLVQGGHVFEQVAVPFKPFRFDGPPLPDDALVLSNWNWFPEKGVRDDRDNRSQ